LGCGVKESMPPMAVSMALWKRKPVRVPSWAAVEAGY
jgi:hypothetical protein